MRANRQYWAHKSESVPAARKLTLAEPPPSLSSVLAPVEAKLDT